MEGNLDPIPVVNPKDVTISISLQGKDFNVKRTTIPSVSNFRQQLNDLKTDKRIDYVAVPSYMEYYANKVDMGVLIKLSVLTEVQVFFLD